MQFTASLCLISGGLARPFLSSDGIGCGRPRDGNGVDAYSLACRAELALWRPEVLMQITGMLYGGRLLDFVEFPSAEVLGPDAAEDEIQALIDRHKVIFIKPLFRGGVGKKGKAGLIGKASDLKTALEQKERLYFVEHRHGNTFAKANGVTFEGGVPAEHEVYFAITDSTEFRAPTMTLTHRGGWTSKNSARMKWRRCRSRR